METRNMTMSKWVYVRYVIDTPSLLKLSSANIKNWRKMITLSGLRKGKYSFAVLFACIYIKRMTSLKLMENSNGLKLRIRDCQDVIVHADRIFFLFVVFFIILTLHTNLLLFFRVAFLQFFF